MGYHLDCDVAVEPALIHLVQEVPCPSDVASSQLVMHHSGEDEGVECLSASHQRRVHLFHSLVGPSTSEDIDHLTVCLKYKQLVDDRHASPFFSLGFLFFVEG